MNTKKLEGVLMIAASCLFLIAALVLILLQWGQQTGFNLYGYPFQVSADGDNRLNVAWLMVLCAIGGVVAWQMIKLLFKGIKFLRAGKISDEAKAYRKSRKDEQTVKTYQTP